MNKKPTIKDVARISESSIATVSRVLNNSEYPVKQELRERILKVAEEIDYKPNIFSKMLKGAASKEIGIIIPSISNPFYAQLVSSVERECLKRNYIPIICSSYNDYDLEMRHIETLIQKQVAGIIMSNIGEVKKLTDKLNHEKMKFVLFDQYYKNMDYSSISFDFYKSGYMAVEFLISNSNKEIAFLTAPFDRLSRKMIFEGYKDALKNHNLPFNKKLVLVSEIPNGENVSNAEFENGFLLADMLLKLKKLPDAIVAINDITAIGIIKGLNTKGVKIPEDISIIGFDDISFSSMITPGLTTMRQSSTITGTQGTRMLIDKIEGKKIENNNILISPELIIRNSVKIGGREKND